MTRSWVLGLEGRSWGLVLGAPCEERGQADPSDPRRGQDQLCFKIPTPLELGWDPLYFKTSAPLELGC